MRNLLILIMLLSACGEARKTGGILSTATKKTENYVLDRTVQKKAQFFTPPGTIDTDSQAYIDNFKAEGAQRNVPTSHSKLVAVTYQDDLTGVDGAGDTVACYGICEMYSEPDGSIESDIKLNTSLNDLPPEEKTLVIDHELGHCLLGIDHTAHDSNDLEIMFWESGSGQIDNTVDYDTNWSSYLDFEFEQQNQEVSP